MYLIHIFQPIEIFHISINWLCSCNNTQEKSELPCFIPLKTPNGNETANTRSRAGEICWLATHEVMPHTILRALWISGKLQLFRDLKRRHADGVEQVLQTSWIKSVRLLGAGNTTYCAHYEKELHLYVRISEPGSE